MVFFYIWLAISMLGALLAYLTSGFIFIPIVLIININGVLIMYYLNKIYEALINDKE